MQATLLPTTIQSVLFIEDDDIMREALALELREEGYDIECAPDGIQGLKNFIEKPASVVILDLLLPHKGGIEVIFELKKSNPDLKIIVVSGALEYQNVAKQLGAWKFLRKPCSVKLLLDTVKEAFVQ